MPWAYSEYLNTTRYYELVLKALEKNYNRFYFALIYFDLLQFFFFLIVTPRREGGFSRNIFIFLDV